jgi:diguanylate cyclase (GGDEF)-like protein/PAS domain S-box-containing protein
MSRLGRSTVALGRLLQSLKFRLALVGVLALAASIGISTSLMLQRIEHDTLQAARTREAHDAEQSARLLAARLREAQQMLVSAATQMPTVRGDGTAALRAYLESKPVLRAGFDALFIASADGQLRLLWDAGGYRSPGTDLSDRPYFQAAMRSAQPVVSQLTLSRVSGDPIVVMALAVRAAGAPPALLAGTLSLQRRDLVRTLTAGASQAGNTHLVAITDRQGLLLAHPESALIGQPLRQEPRLAAAASQLLADGRPAPAAARALNTDDALVQAVPVDGTGWLVWRWRPVSDVLAPLAAGRREAILVALGLLAATGAGLALLMARLLRPLRQLQARAWQLRHDELLPDEAWPQADGEIGELTQVLRQVAISRAELATANDAVMRRLQSVMLAAPVGICFTKSGRFELVSTEMCRLIGRREADLVGQPAQLIYASNEDYMALGPRVGEAFAAGQAFVGELQFLRASGERFSGRLRGLPVDFAEPGAGTVWTLIDITGELAARTALEWAATHDALTGLANRQGFESRLAALFAQPASRRPAALLMMDLDRFKLVNDTHGHAAGDAVLRAVAAAIQGCVRGTDLAVRLGGDEFAVLLENCPTDVAHRVAEQVRQRVTAARVPWQGQSLAVGVSVGAVALADAHANALQWLAAADKACYEAKAAGRTQAIASAHLRLVNGALQEMTDRV